MQLGSHEELLSEMLKEEFSLYIKDTHKSLKCGFSALFSPFNNHHCQLQLVSTESIYAHGRPLARCILASWHFIAPSHSQNSNYTLLIQPPINQ
jgi:hypothetical protein